ncbi:MAG: hypothetical protein AAF628_36050 [Planctomycetota bacterium]
MDWAQILIGTGVGAVIFFVWNAIAWMGLQHHKADYVPLPNAAEVADALARVPPTGAFYALPHFAAYEKGLNDPAFDARMRQGPNAMIVRFESGPAMQGKTFGQGFAINLTEAFCCSLAVAFAGAKLTGWGPHVLLTVGMGVFACVAVYFALSVWAQIPWRFAFSNTFDKVIGYGLVGTALYFLGVSGAG